MERKVVSLFKKQQGFSGVVNVVSDWSEVASIQKKQLYRSLTFLDVISTSFMACTIFMCS